MRDIAKVTKFFQKYAKQKLSIFDYLFDIDKVENVAQEAKKNIMLGDYKDKSNLLNILQNIQALVNNLYIDVNEAKKHCLKCDGKGLIKKRQTWVLCSCMRDARYSYFNTALRDDTVATDYISKSINKIGLTSKTIDEKNIFTKKCYLNLDFLEDAYKTVRYREAYYDVLKRVKERKYRIEYLQNCKARIEIGSEVFEGRIPIFVIGALVDKRASGVYFALKTSARGRDYWVWDKPNNYNLKIIASNNLDGTEKDILDDVYECINRNKNAIKGGKIYGEF